MKNKAIFQMRLRVRLIWMAIAVLLPIVVFSGVALHTLMDAHRVAAIRSMHETARATTLIVDREISKSEAALKILASSESLNNRDFARFYDKARLVSRNSPTWIILYDADGRQIINTRLPYGSTLPSRSHPEELTEILQSGQARVSGLMWARSLERQTILVDMPVSARDGGRYVLSQAFMPDYFNLAFENRGIPPTWITGIFDSNGVTIARNRDAATFVGKMPMKELLQLIRSGGEGPLRHFTRDGVEVYDVVARSAISGWSLGIGAPVAEVDAAAHRALLVSSLGLFAAIAVALIIAGLVGRSLVRSIAQSGRMAAALGRGTALPACDSSGVQEIDELRGSITEAAALLQEEKRARTLAEGERERLLVVEQEARQQAEAENKAKDQFLAMLGHELRNPLAAITSAIGVMEVQDIPAEKDDRARAILRRQSMHLAGIVDDLLDMSRVLAGKIVLEKQQIDLAAVAASCVDTLRSTGRMDAHEVSIDTAPVMIDADPKRIEQIITNLIDNALKYTPPEGRIAIHVQPQGDAAVFVIRDNGIGISRELLPRIFDPLFQGESTMDRAKGGLGIGLSLVRHLLALHGGAVTAESEGAGHGSTFTVTLPRAAGEQPQPAADDAGKLAAKGAILIVEDNADSREMMMALLAFHGFAVLEAADGDQGLRIAQEVRPPVALVDIGLPGIDGYQVARQLRARPETRSMKLIALTGYGMEEDQKRAAEAGFDLHLTKPLNFDQLLAALNG